MGRWQPAEDVADGVGLDLLQTNLGKAPGQPCGAGSFAEGRRGNGGQINLPVHDGLGVAVHPGKSGMNRTLRGQSRYPGKCRVVGKQVHRDGLRVAATGLLFWILLLEELADIAPTVNDHADKDGIASDAIEDSIGFEEDLAIRGLFRCLWQV